MKKLWKSDRFLKFQKGRQRRAEHVQKRRDSVRAARPRREKKPRPPRRPRTEIVAPERFSLMQAPEDTLRFLAEIRAKSKNWEPVINLRSVTLIDPEAVAAFVAVMESMPEAHVSGNQPLDPLCRQRLHDFGFFEHVDGVQSSGLPSGKIRIQHSGRDVDGNVAGEIMEFGMEKLGRSGRKHGPTYSIFLEAMANTLQHAAGNSRTKKSWWAGVYYDESKAKASFTVVDMGVGILESVTFRQRFAFLAASKSPFRIGSTAGQKLQALLEGRIPSRTGEKFRGRGLPSMYEACKSRRINNLTVICNNASANAETQAFKELKQNFSGTIIYWEVEKETRGGTNEYSQSR